MELTNYKDLKYEIGVCEKCNRRKRLHDIHQICYICYLLKTEANSSENKVIDDFINYTQTNCVYGGRLGRLEYVPYEHFKDIEFIAEEGFNKVFKATWIYGPHPNWVKIISRIPNCPVVLKKLNDSKNVTTK